MKGDFKTASADLTRAVELDPTKAAYYSTLAIAYAAEGATLKRASDCDTADAYGARGWAYVCKAEVTQSFPSCDTAIAAFTTLIKANPRDASAYIGRGRAYNDKWKYDEAIGDENQALRLAPRSSRAYNDRGISYTSKGDQDRAIADFTKSIGLSNPTGSIKDRASVYANRGISYSIKEKYREAITDFNRAISLNPTDTSFYRSRAIAYFQTTNYKAAIADLINALQRDSAEPRNYNDLAWYLATCPQRDFRDGKRAIQYATKSCEMTNWNRGDFIDTLAASFAETGEFEKAISREEEA